jgi:hypothetical protein
MPNQVQVQPDLHTINNQNKKEKRMSTLLLNKRMFLPILLLALALAGYWAFLTPNAEAANVEKPTRTLVVEIAQNMASFVADEAPVHEDGLPAHGNSFVIQGFLYPEGTLNGSNGIIVSEDEQGNISVEPEFPDLVIGTWFCRGWFTGEGLHSQDEPYAITVQLFDFHEGYGGTTITSDGYEIPFGLDAALHRAVTGGTGQYAGARGEQVQQVIGINATQAANFRVEFSLDKK